MTEEIPCRSSNIFPELSYLGDKQVLVSNGNLCGGRCF